VTEHHIRHETGFLERKRGARDFLAIEHAGLNFPQVMMGLSMWLSLRCVSHRPNSRQNASLSLSQKHNLIAWLSTELPDQMNVLARKILVGEKKFHRRCLRVQPSRDLRD
jgi:hypothetical protein